MACEPRDPVIAAACTRAASQLESDHGNPRQSCFPQAQTALYFCRARHLVVLVSSARPFCHSFPLYARDYLGGTEGTYMVLLAVFFRRRRRRFAAVREALWPQD
jgi:hypothetical protein